MAKQLRIEVSGGIVMYADLLEDLAPQTCAALEKALPYQDKVLSHGMFSGHALYLLTDMEFGKAECSRSYGVSPGEILYAPHVVDDSHRENELIIVYGPAAIRNVSGFGIVNLCARIRYEYWQELYQLGIDIIRLGERTVTFSLEDK